MKIVLLLAKYVALSAAARVLRWLDVRVDVVPREEADALVRDDERRA